MSLDGSIETPSTGGSICDVGLSGIGVGSTGVLSSVMGPTLGMRFPTISERRLIISV